MIIQKFEVVSPEKSFYDLAKEFNALLPHEYKFALKRLKLKNPLSSKIYISPPQRKVRELMDFYLREKSLKICQKNIKFDFSDKKEKFRPQMS